MKRKLSLCIIMAIILWGNIFAKTSVTYAPQVLPIMDSISKDSMLVDSLALHKVEIDRFMEQIRKVQISDSIKRAELMQQIEQLKENEQLKRKQLSLELDQLSLKDSLRRIENLERIDKLRSKVSGFPVIPFEDTLFIIYNKLGVLSPHERAMMISNKIKQLYEDESFHADSMVIEASDFGLEINYGDMTILTISDNDAIWLYKTKEEVADEYLTIIKNAIKKHQDNNSLSKILIRVGLVLLILFGIYWIIWITARIFNKLQKKTLRSRWKYIKDIQYKNYTLISAKNERRIMVIILKAFKWMVILLNLYFMIPLILSIFPVTRGWADEMYYFIKTPFYHMFEALWDYMPNLFMIAVIIFCSRYVLRFVRYIFREIESDKLQFSGFHRDWAAPTYSIVRIVLYAFIFILLFPYLPKSNSDIFKGVSVFVGVLFSLGSSSAISNMIAGLVITYMRPFKVGDHIKIGEMRGDVIEKTLLVTRLRTLKNEEITIPNSSVLSSNTINYSSYVNNPGLIVYTSVTIGYDVPRKDVEEALLAAAVRCHMIRKNPKPFVLEQSLNDFHIEYQLNAYTTEANRQATVYSDIRKHIIDVFNERGIEIMSPNYHAIRDGNKVTIPVNSQ